MLAKTVAHKHKHHKGGHAHQAGHWGEPDAHGQEQAPWAEPDAPSEDARIYGALMPCTVHALAFASVVAAIMWCPGLSAHQLAVLLVVCAVIAM